MADGGGLKVLAGVPDLFFASRIGETARQLGVAVEFASSQQTLLAKAAQGPAMVILDLGAAALDPIGVITQLKSDPATKDIRIIGFLNHERTDLLHQARQAGCDDVMTRGAFAKGLPMMLSIVRAV
jgi:CheY-like chemotaxis protein